MPTYQPILQLTATVVVVLLSAMTMAAEDREPNLAVIPVWAQEAVWYQIFVERFRNGDPTNDPSIHDIQGAWPHVIPQGWAPTPWTHQWYESDPWAKRAGLDLYTNIPARRYGGDLQGIIDKLDYLQELGVTALYLNPINDSPSLHKYDARNYRHIDRNFGPNPRGDERLMAQENAVDPRTWEWSAADTLFLKLIDEVHRRNMHIIIDYSWNHTGSQFWAWRDVVQRQRNSPFADWYEIDEFDDPTTPDNEFSYRGWAGVKTLPEIRKLDARHESTPHGSVRRGDLPPAVKAHIGSVTRRWLDPNGDGDPRDGVDGFRLDVAELVPIDFWREFRKLVRNVNPQAFLVGEIWWQQYPDQLRDPGPWLAGDMFDAVMHYHWYRPTRSFVSGAPPALTAAGYRDRLQSLGRDIRPEVARAMMNLVGSHDSPRVATSLANPGKYKYRAGARRNAAYGTGNPAARVRALQKLVLVQQFTWIGSPHIYYGDEVGMWGADDPDCRKPMVWADLEYASETVHPHGDRTPADRVAVDRELLAFYKRLIQLRREHIGLFARGRVRFLMAGDSAGVLAYERTWHDRRAIVVLNVSHESRRVRLRVPIGAYRNTLSDDGETHQSDDTLEVDMGAHEALVLM